MKVYTEEEMLDKHIGKKGSAERENFDNKLRADVLAYKFKQLSKRKHLTQKELEEKITEYAQEVMEI